MLKEWAFWISSLHPEQLLAAIAGLLLIDGPRYVLSTTLMCLWDAGREFLRFLTGRTVDENYAYCPSACVVIVGHNESETVGATLASLWGTYPKMEIIVVDDGSTDEMALVARHFAANHSGIRVFSRPRRGGKASAMNLARQQTKAEVIVQVDADSHLGERAIWEIVQPLEDPAVGAVSATVLVRHPFYNLATWLQAYEYLHTIFMGRMFTSRIGTLAIVSGALGAYRTSALKQLMGWDVGHGEDGDLTLRMRKSKFRVAFAPYSQCYTNVPTRWRKLFKQRRRWNRGVIRHKSRKHIDMAFFWSKNFQASNLLHLLDAWFFRVACLFGFWGFALFHYLNPTEDTWKLLVTIYLLYTAFHVVQILSVVYYSRAPLRDLLVCAVVPLVPFYQTFLKAARLVSICEELFLRASFQDDFYPQHVRDATWHW